MYNFNPFKDALKETESWLDRELSLVRTGRANPAALDSIRVDAYGTPVPIVQVGSVLVEDARAIRIAPWDTTQIKAVEKAIVSADLGLSVVVDEKGIRVIFPELTGERRKEIARNAKEKLEHARTALRAKRDDALATLEKKFKAKEMGEDDKFRFKTEIEKLSSESGKRLEAAAAKKEKEILS